MGLVLGDVVLHMYKEWGDLRGPNKRGFVYQNYFAMWKISSAISHGLDNIDPLVVLKHSRV